MISLCNLLAFGQNGGKAPSDRYIYGEVGNQQPSSTFAKGKGKLTLRLKSNREKIRPVMSKLYGMLS